MGFVFACYHTAKIFLLLGAFLIVGSASLWLRVVFAGDPNEPVPDDPTALFVDRIARHMKRTEKRSVPIYKFVSRVLFGLGVGLILTAGVAALFA